MGSERIVVIGAELLEQLRSGDRVTRRTRARKRVRKRMSSNNSARESPSALAYWVSDEGGRGAVLSTCMHHQLEQVCVDVAMCVMKSLPFVSISTYAPPAHRRASGAASGGAVGRSAPPRAARAPPFSFLPNTEKLPLFL